MEPSLVNAQNKGAALLDTANRELDRLFPDRNIRNVLLVLPSDSSSETFNYDTAKRCRYWNYPPYGLGILASNLQKNGINVRIVNLNNEILKACLHSSSEISFDFDRTWKAALVAAMEFDDYQLIGISCMFTMTHRAVIQVSKEIKRLAPKIPLALGGVHITNCFLDKELVPKILTDFSSVDLFFFHEAERSFDQFISTVNHKSSPAGLSQVYFNSGTSKLFFPEKDIPIDTDLDVIPAYALMHPDEISRHGVIGSFTCLKDTPVVAATIISNRGCRGKCTYCSVHNFNGAGVRHRSIQSIIDELKLLCHDYGVNHVMWLDDDLLYNHNRSMALFNAISRSKLDMTWDCTNGVIAASCTTEILSAASESGCIGMNIGIESGNPEILRRIRKPASIHTFRKAAKAMKEFPQINTRGFLMIGFPEETYSKLFDTYKLAIDMDLDWYNITILQPLPNTPLFDEMLEQGTLNGIDCDDIRYNSGPYGKKRQSAIKKQYTPLAFSSFDEIPGDICPTRSDLESIWFYMNYNLNFSRLFKLENITKLNQHFRYVKYITEKVAPNDPIPMYFYGFLEYKLSNSISATTIQRLESCLRSSPYWSSIFEHYGLSSEHLRNLSFPL